MERKRFLSVRIKYFLMGILFIAGVVLLMGYSNGSPRYGRYQLSSWGTSFGDLSGGCGAFITDTTTGKTKTAYLYIYGTSDGISVLRNNLGKSFFEIK